jgi:hypothetical protein
MIIQMMVTYFIVSVRRIAIYGGSELVRIELQKAKRNHIQSLHQKLQTQQQHHFSMSLGT